MKIDLTNKNDYEIISLYISSTDDIFKREIINYIYLKYLYGIKKLCRRYVNYECDLEDTLQDAYFGVEKAFQYTTKVTCDPSIFRIWMPIRSHVSSYLKNRNRYISLRRLDTVSINASDTNFSETFEALLEDRKYNIDDIVLGSEYVDNEIEWYNTIERKENKEMIKMLINNYNYADIGRKVGLTRQAIGLHCIKMKKDYNQFMKKRGLL